LISKLILRDQSDNRNVLRGSKANSGRRLRNSRRYLILGGAALQFPRENRKLTRAMDQDPEDPSREAVAFISPGRKPRVSGKREQVPEGRQPFSHTSAPR